MADEEILVVPPIPKAVYRAAFDASRESQEVGDRIACAVEATWQRAFRAGHAAALQEAAE